MLIISLIVQQLLIILDFWLGCCFFATEVYIFKDLIQILLKLKFNIGENMAILPITLYGDKILREKSKDILKIDDRIIKIVEDMFDTMHNADGVGLAANQVNLDKSIFVIDLRPVEGYEKTKPLVFINPKITLRSENLVPHDEGCLSLPYIRAEVIRPKPLLSNILILTKTCKNLKQMTFGESYSA
jgi:peptide deformylase